MSNKVIIHDWEKHKLIIPGWEEYFDGLCVWDRDNIHTFYNAQGCVIWDAVKDYVSSLINVAHRKGREEGKEE